MDNKYYYLPINEIGQKSFTKKGKAYPNTCLHYIHPSSGGWGVVRVALLVPESVMLFIAAQGCARHGSLAGHIHGYNKKVFFLGINECDLVNGTHTNKIEGAVKEILKRVKVKPKALILCSTCFDDLLGTDYEYIAESLEKKFKIKVRAAKMDPIRLDTSKSPALMVHKTMFSYLNKSEEKDGGINILGSFASVLKSSEMYTVLKNSGFKHIRHIADYSSFDSFQDMAKSSFNILIKPPAKLAANDMEKYFNIPYIFENVSYGIDSIKKTYENIGKFLGVELDTEKYYEQTKNKIAKYKKKLGDVSFAIGQTANASPFELAHALISYGFSVPYIFAADIISSDYEHIEWLKQNAKDLKVFTNIHPSMANYKDLKLDVDIAIGLDAGYFCKKAKTVPLTLDIQPYGYGGAVYLFEKIIEAYQNNYSHKELLYSAGMVV